MQIIKREELPEQRQVRLTIAVDKDTWQASLAKCYQGVKSVCPVAGEPTRENLEQAYGPEFLYQEAVNDTYPQALVEAISQSDIQIAGTPTLSVETIGPDGYTFAAVIDLYPEVELGQYKGLSAVYPQVELSNDDTEAALDEYARANPDVQHPERAAMGDEVTLDFEGFVDGVPFEGGKGEQYPLLLGSGYFIPGFEEQVAGAAVGEERDVKVTFPTEYVPELAGKDAVFHIKVHQITRRAMPEWDDDFARRQGFADVSALRRAVMETAVQKKQAQAAEQFANDLIRQVTEAMTVTIPAAMVENQLDGLINELRGHLQAQGVSLEQYLEMGNTTMEQLRDHAREQAAAAACSRAWSRSCSIVVFPISRYCSRDTPWACRWPRSSLISPSSWFSTMAAGMVTVMASVTWRIRSLANCSAAWACFFCTAVSMTARRRAETSAKPCRRAKSSSHSGMARRVIWWTLIWNTASLPASSGTYSVGKVTFTSRSSPTAAPATCSSKPGMK